MKLPKFSNKNLFFNTFKRMRPMTVLFSIVLCLGMPVVSMLAFSSLNFPELEMERLAEMADSIAHILGREFVLVSAAFGVFAGCTVMRGYMKRQSAVLFSSLPVRREKLFAINFASGWLSYLLSAVIAVVLTVLVFLMYGAIGHIGGLFSCLCAGFVWFFFAYALTIFAGSLCGMTSIQFLLTGVVLAYLPATVALIAIMVDDVFYEFINVNHYLSVEVMEYLSPVVRIFVNVIASFMEEDGGLGVKYLYSGALSYTAVAVLLTLCTVLVLRVRKHEKAGSPIVFSTVNGVVKYAVMVPCALLTGIVFYVTEEVGAMVIGLIIGAVLAFMLMNVILSKDPRAYFKGLKGLAVFTVCFAVCFSLIAFDPLGLDEYIPSADSVKSATIYLDGYEVEFTDKEDIEAINRLMAEGQKSEESDDAYYSYYLVDYYDDEAPDAKYSMSVDVVYRTESGIELAKYAYIWDTEPVEEDVQKLILSTEYRDCVLDGAIEYLGNKYANTSADFLAADYSSGKFSGYMDAYEYISVSDAKRVIELMKETNVPLYSDENGPQIAVLNIGGGYMIPLYYDGEHSEIYEFLADKMKYYDLPTEDIDAFLAGFDKVRVYDGEEYVEYTDRDKIKELFLSSVGFNARSSMFDMLETGDGLSFFSGPEMYYTYLRD